MVGDRALAPVVLDLTAAQPPLAATVHTVVIYKGPGSWKTEAWWDEYIVTLANQGDAPLTLESVSLVDVSGESKAPGTDPWAIDAQSRAWWKKAGRDQGNTATPFALGMHPVWKAGAYTLVGVTSATGWLLVGTGLATATTAGVVVMAWPAYALGAVAVNSNNKKKVAAEFEHRRLVTPAIVPGHGMVQGSLFFRITPAPRRLVVHGSSDGQIQEASVDLASLAGLHLKPAAPPVVPPPP